MFLLLPSSFLSNWPLARKLSRGPFGVEVSVTEGVFDHLRGAIQLAANVFEVFTIAIHHTHAGHDHVLVTILAEGRDCLVRGFEIPAFAPGEMGEGFRALGGEIGVGYFPGEVVLVSVKVSRMFVVEHALKGAVVVEASLITHAGIIRTRRLMEEI